MAKTPMGYKCIVNNTYEGMIFHTEIFENIEIGETKKAYLKVARPDGKLDLALQRTGKEASGADSSEKLLSMLKENAGKLPYNYTSDAQDIQNVFGLSKKAYKRTLTALIDAEKIEVKDTGIYLK